MFGLNSNFAVVVVAIVCSVQTTHSRATSLLDLVHARAEAIRTNNGVHSRAKQANITNAPEPVTTPASVQNATSSVQLTTGNAGAAGTTATETLGRWEPPGKANICDTMCPRWCRIGSLEEGLLDCHYECLRLCDEQATVNNPYVGNTDYEVVASQFQFDHYDVNGDKRISMEEFMQSEIIPMEEIVHVFQFADVNDDGYIDVDEFTGGPLVFTVQMTSEMNQLTRAGNLTIPIPEPDRGRI